MTDELTEAINALSDTAELVGRPMSERALTLWLSDVSDLAPADVIEALRLHRNDPERGRFMPSPGDIRRAIAEAAKQDGRPTAIEAYALLPRTEAESAFMTLEMLQAQSEADALGGDRYAHRTAFVAVYDRLVQDARQSRREVVWQWSPGHDAHLRADAIDRARGKGLVPPGLLSLVQDDLKRLGKGVTVYETRQLRDQGGVQQVGDGVIAIGYRAATSDELTAEQKAERQAELRALMNNQPPTETPQ